MNKLVNKYIIKNGVSAKASNILYKQRSKTTPDLKLEYPLILTYTIDIAKANMHNKTLNVK